MSSQCAFLQEAEESALNLRGAPWPCPHPSLPLPGASQPPAGPDGECGGHTSAPHTWQRNHSAKPLLTPNFTRQEWRWVCVCLVVVIWYYFLSTKMNDSECGETEWKWKNANQYTFLSGDRYSPSDCVGDVDLRPCLGATPSPRPRAHSTSLTPERSLGPRSRSNLGFFRHSALFNH